MRTANDAETPQANTRRARRVQLETGGRVPAGAVSIAGASQWANPFVVEDVASRFPEWPCEDCVSFTVGEFRDLVRFDAGGHRCGEPLVDHIPIGRRDGPRRRRVMTYPSLRAIQNELGGRDLACSCDPSDACHGDLLLVLANPRPPRHRGLQPSADVFGDVPSDGYQAHDRGFHIGDCPHRQGSSEESHWRRCWIAAEVVLRRVRGEFLAPE